jgi:hypothetical protein
MKRWFAVAAIALVPILACSAIVTGEIPEFACSSNDPSACPPNNVCDLTLGRCVLDAGAPDEAGDDETSPTEGGKDGPVEGSEAGPAALGAACGSDGDCASGLCGDSQLLTTDITSGSICTQTCCTSLDCPSSFVCFSAGTGGNYCVPAASANRTPAASAGKNGGVACTGSTECRSGLCSNNKCLDTCCAQKDCAAGSICAVASIPAPTKTHDIWVCVPSISGLKNLGTNCGSQPECKNDNCVGSPPVCTPSCCNSKDCDDQGAPDFAGYTCSYGLSATDQLKWCTPVVGSRAPLETTCSQPFDCQSFYCDPELKKCMLPCCVDGDCGSNEICRPSAQGIRFLRCVPKVR